MKSSSAMKAGLDRGSVVHVRRAAPAVSSIAPSEGSTAGGTAVTIKGSNFDAGATVTIGGAASAVIVHSSGEITAVTSAQPAGPEEVIVSDAAGSSSGGPAYTYAAPPTDSRPRHRKARSKAAGRSRSRLPFRSGRHGHDRRRGHRGERPLGNGDHGDARPSPRVPTKWLSATVTATPAVARATRTSTRPRMPPCPRLKPVPRSIWGSSASPAHG